MLDLYFHKCLTCGLTVIIATPLFKDDFHSVLRSLSALMVVNKTTAHSMECILGNPGATSRDDAIFSGESLLQELESPWELTLTEPVPEVVEFRLADWPEKYFSDQSARSSIRVTLSPSYTKQFSSSIDQVVWPVQRGN